MHIALPPYLIVHEMNVQHLQSVQIVMSLVHHHLQFAPVALVTTFEILWKL